MHRIDDRPIAPEPTKNCRDGTTNRVLPRPPCLDELRPHAVNRSRALHQHTPRDPHVVYECLALELQLEFTDGSVLDTLPALEQTAGAADFEQPRRNIPGQHPGDVGGFSGFQIRRRRFASHSIDPTMASRSRWRTMPSITTGTLLATRTFIVFSGPD